MVHSCWSPHSCMDIRLMGVLEYYKVSLSTQMANESMLISVSVTLTTDPSLEGKQANEHSTKCETLFRLSSDGGGTLSSVRSQGRGRGTATARTDLDEISASWA